MLSRVLHVIIITWLFSDDKKFVKSDILMYRRIIKCIQKKKKNQDEYVINKDVNRWNESDPGSNFCFCVVFVSQKLSTYREISCTRLFVRSVFVQIARLENDLDLKRAWRTDSNRAGTVKQVIDYDFETVATRTWVCEELSVLIKGHVFDFNFVVNSHFA